MGKLTGKVALVTGAGRGLGRAYALKLASLGADVVINDLHLDSAREFDEALTADTVMEECERYGVQALGIAADMTQRSEVNRMFDEALARFGRLDVLINNTGGVLRPAERGFASTVSEDDWRFILDVNLTSTLFCCQAAAVPMKAQRSGKIINVSSQAGVQGNPDGSVAHYSVAKAGVIEYTRLLAGELGPYNVTVNCIAPGLIVTSRADKQFGRGSAESRARLEPRIALRRLGEPEDCARVIEFLATDLSDYVTGQNLCIDGGMVLFPS